MNKFDSTNGAARIPTFQDRPVVVEIITENDAQDDLTSAIDLSAGLTPNCDTRLLWLSNGIRKDKSCQNAIQLWKNDPELSRKLKLLFSALQPDIVHTHRIEELATVGAAARLAGVPNIVHSLCGKVGGAQKARLKHLTSVIETLSPLLIVPNETIASILPLSAQVEILPTGIDCNRYTLGDQARARRQIGLPAAPRIIGCASPTSSLNTLLHAIFQMERDVHLALFGVAQPSSMERDLIRRLDLEERIHVLGPWAKPEQAYQAIDVYFHGPSGDCLPRAVLAAQACGKPAIACAPTPSKVLCPVTGRLAPTEFAPTLVHSLRRTLKSTDPETTRRFVTENWHLEQSLDRYGNLFQQLFRQNLQARRLA